MDATIIASVLAALLASWAWIGRRFVAQLDATTKLASKTADHLDRIADRLDRLEANVGR